MPASIIKKAVFPIAGLGTRFLPITKASPKEMLPIIDKPLIQYAVEEAIEAGITEIIFVTSANKTAVENHFDRNLALEQALLDKSKQEEYMSIRSIVPKNVSCVYIRQAEAKGLGDAVLTAAPLIGKEDFALLLADDWLDAGDQQVCIAELMRLHQKYQTCILSVMEVADDKLSEYGIVDADEIKENRYHVSGIVEKPKENAPSNLGVVGRYVLSNKILGYLSRIKADASGEFQLTDALSLFMEDEPLFAQKFTGRRFDCGSKQGYILANLHAAMQDDQYKRAVMEYFRDSLAAAKV